MTSGDASTLTVTWDARVFEITGTALLTVRGQITSVTFADRADGIATLRLPLGAERVYLPSRTVNLYPSENIGKPRASVISIGDTNGAEVQKVELPVASEDVSAWGVELAVDWISLSEEITPSRATIKSVGPSPIEVGVAFVFSFPASAGEVSEAALDESEERYLSITTQVSDGVTTATIVTTEAIPAETSTYLVFAASVSDSEPTMIVPIVPRLALQTETASNGMRQTNMMSCFPLTNVGSHLSTYVVETAN
ncbi:hypothetical protein [Microbacterium trichothecenolyticum]|uniref:Uncharacterized protein n=1 Tax=Microbacterium trichothecenolyticum TaxID=69370 RepID=A0ABU0TZ60_MICTR|nr:hypothetical protein [Microbacterium trichothecenolyticum]MDQ1124947.1 hypothetical protein [Microbacterium trichothecenolyticum]